ncbi:hypothetical protein [Microbacterium oxydans]|uniref:Uncharacterized protein n=1 Tax=Microbacterium oxydans TaxID=82380 RepID=A0A0F0L2Y8_9MICO|nr:hypothetical protein [Microbacterium oxydans]KJL27517.1 hypothetical protein RS83_02565 [Microbacterium oxydans]
MGTNEPAGISRRTTMKAAAWSVPVVVATVGIPLAAASVAPEATAFIATTCGGRDRLTLYITNNTSSALQTFVDVDLDDNGTWDAGDGPILNPGETQPLGYGLMENGAYTFRVSTANSVIFQKRVVLDCEPVGLRAWTTGQIENGTSPVMIVHLQNETSSQMQTYIDLDWDRDGTPDSGDGPILAPNEYQEVRYDLWFNDFGVTARNDIGYALNTRIGFGGGPNA